jgi:hypothetical protein
VRPVPPLLITERGFGSETCSPSPLAERELRSEA